MSSTASWPLNFKHGEVAKLAYGPSYKLDDMILVEMDEDILEETLTSGVHIVGSSEGEAVMCTRNKTYAMKMLETSNTVLLVPPPSSQDALADGAKEDETSGSMDEDEAENLSLDPKNSQNRLPGLLTQIEKLKGKTADGCRQVVAVSRVSGNMELVQVAPDISSLDTLLRQHPYTQAEAMGLEDDAPVPPCKRGYTTSQLLSGVQASLGELETGLAMLSAVEIDGKWRFVDEPYAHTVLDMLLCDAVENEWSLCRIPLAEAVSAMTRSGVHPSVARGVIRMCASSTPPPTSAATGGETKEGELSYVALDTRAVCVLKARGLLAQNQRWRVQDFVYRWEQEVPNGIEPALDMLRGEALVETVGLEKFLVNFRADTLPRQPAARFDALFGQRARWEWDDLHPYLEGIQNPGQSVEALLLKFTRQTKPDAHADPVYSKR
mmetsp:Transcript_38649/g.74100  ORF Transcript_38649/g.74100 Transcript_38649/m.74100 type:complete len:437 (-) Transcript_38649:294-1604(-)|eukprot:CAMPEP_0114226362 /NCGR_PEP_ID=MMETSP0058-20121206/1195_1 /TAXON_ID=36894 /ORGANISM="Pyramimonas parkeae, CCMP726" /LENGTH=436 /DNA_ID=CAMNT_0001337089 /DNA_START=122 /DNA_END=1432 /DNA_ORIENTATION=+